ncbi:hypothetical protein [Metabacillus sp. FJAT-52054]|uniref:Uncharacterized protein n=1 Tax=Metabacillus sediminis TaxID=3117746 RepID=A0ABZ2NHG6_9BACI
MTNEMVELYFLEPEVSGNHGEQTVYGSAENVKREGISGKIQFLHYEFQGWLGDDLAEATPAFIISSRLEEALRNSHLKDCKIEPCLITASDEFKERQPDIAIPAFYRWIPLGTIDVEGQTYKNWSGHHFCLSAKGELVVTKTALDLLKKFSMDHCDVIPLTPVQIS